MKKIFFTFFSLFLGLNYSLFAQFTFDGQIVQRAEYRNGFGNLIGQNQEAAVFMGQRTRIQASYQIEKLKFYASVQDIRTWGNTPQVKATDGFLSLHEGWAEFNLSEKWTAKVGRQELNYDNFRFLGNLDWALQARAHDFALIKYEKENMKLHFGGGFNQQDQRLNSTTYTLANQYKTAQMIRYENQWTKWQVSLLFWNEGRELNGTHFFRQTIGIPNLKYQSGNITFSGFYYHQLGNNPLGKAVNAFNASLQIKQKVGADPEKGKSWQWATGFELISGTATNEKENNESFSPLYGTNHLFNGYMDLFFVGGQFENSVGLQDYYVKIRREFSSKLFLQADAHWFQSYGKVFDQSNLSLESYLGTELDFSLGYTITNAVSLQAGYSQIFASNTLAYLKGVSQSKDTQNWAYLMLIVRPTMKNKFIGILF